MDDGDGHDKEPIPTAELSGAVRKMRFMKRSEPLLKRTSTESTAEEPLSNGKVDSAGGFVVAVEMYGLSGHVVGRRSFGGRNQHVEKMYKASQASFVKGVLELNPSENGSKQNRKRKHGGVTRSSEKRR